ncbi:hypothetical protein BDP27DRAFT_1310988 [Rhodocollybia butyracea]|uniref:F-box domain-containing protein n=1 Tax=Rhodocollybia butyracea TaxID=206335 RepID=A0A9P5QBE8_9AGAR|nr:hypothetical protein BDP27DRAFT_1310988 [Rhodocollybia butyracea]
MFALNLPFDVYEHVISHLLNENTADAISLSMVSRQMRNNVLPVVFCQVRWPKNREPIFFPSSLWPYIKKFEFSYDNEPPWSSRHIAYLTSLSEALPHLPNIVTFIYTIQKFAPNISLIEALASSPSLQSLHISTPFLIHDASALLHSFHGIRRLVIEQMGQATLYSAPAHKRALSIQCVANIVQGCSESLEYLEVPGEYCPLSDLESGIISLPTLRKLIIKGFPPMESDSHKYPLWTVVKSMPRLNVLEIHCRLRIIGALPHRYELLPREALIGSEMDSFSSQIESITISNPSLSDQIFKRLPHSLRYLVLDFIPGWENMLSSGDTLAYHNPNEVLRLFNSLSTEGVKHFSRPHLEQLCIKMGWCITVKLLKSIYQTFPGLQGLELQGIRYFNRAEEPESDMEGIAAILEKFQHLDTLKLAVELREDSYQEDISRIRQIGSVDESMQYWANILGERVLTLQRLAFEKRRHTGKGYGRRAAIGTPLWVWFLPNVHHVGSDTMRRSEEIFD